VICVGKVSFAIFNACIDPHSKMGRINERPGSCWMLNTQLTVFRDLRNDTDKGDG
jgi:hypothetical protein